MDNVGKKVALVTGASSGIGEVTAERLAQEGYKVYGTSRRAAQSGQRSFQMLALDVTRDDSVDAVVADVMRSAGRIDLLVNNAGFGIATAGAEDAEGKPTLDPHVKQFIGVITSFTVEGSGIDNDVDALAGAYHLPVHSGPRYKGLDTGLADRLDAARRDRFRF